MSGPDRLASVAVALWRRHLVAGLALVGALPIAACSQPATTRGAVTESTRVADPDLHEPVEYLRLGLTLDEDGIVVVLVPDCPGVVVTSVSWAAPQALYTFWSAHRSSAGEGPSEITIGTVPPGFVEYVPVDAASVAAWDHRDSLVVVGRDGESGASVAAGVARLRPADLQFGRIDYGAGSASPSEFTSSEEFRRRATCEPVLDE